MSEAINSLTSSYSKSDINRKSHSTPGKSNFKKFALLHQNNASSIKLEETLPKTSDLRHSKTDDTLKTSDLGFVKSSPSRLRGSNTEKDIKQLFERRSSLLEDDHKNQRSPLEEIQFESSLLRSNQSSIRKVFPKESELLRSEEGKRQRIKLNEENELMRSGSKENSIISPKKYGSGMKRSYNEITSTHEEKVKILFYFEII